jgi:hypothetical protein
MFYTYSFLSFPFPLLRYTSTFKRRAEGRGDQGGEDILVGEAGRVTNEIANVVHMDYLGIRFVGSDGIFQGEDVGITYFMNKYLLYCFSYKNEL